MSVTTATTPRIVPFTDQGKVGNLTDAIRHGDVDKTIAALESSNGDVRVVVTTPGCRGHERVTVCEGARLGTAAGNAGVEEVLADIKPDFVVVSEASLRAACEASWGGDNVEAARITESLRPMADRIGVPFMVYAPGDVSTTTEHIAEAPDPRVGKGLRRGVAVTLHHSSDDVLALLGAFTPGQKREWRGEPVTGGELLHLTATSKTAPWMQASLMTTAGTLRRQYDATKSIQTAADWIRDLMSELRGAALVLIDNDLIEAGTVTAGLKLDPSALAKGHGVAVAVVS